MASRKKGKKRTGRKEQPVIPERPVTRRQLMQIAVPFLLPMFWFASLWSLLKLDYPLLAWVLGLPALVGALAFGYLMRVAAKKAAVASTRPVSRLLYGLTGLCLFALMVLLAQLSYAESHASGNAAVSITFGFLAFYCAIGGVLALGRALARGPKRLSFWLFIPRWIDSKAKQPQSHGPATDRRRGRAGSASPPLG